MYRLQLDNDLQTYLLGLWLKYAYHETGLRETEKGTKLNTFMTQLAIESMKGMFEWMTNEFPPMLYGALMSEANTKNCSENVKSYI